MKIVVIGGTGLIGSKLVHLLTEKGHEAVPASPNSGVDTVTGVGLTEVLTGADVVVDVANSPSFDAAAVLDFFRTSGRNLLAAEKAAGVGHHVALSVVGADRLRDSGYMRAKIAQEELIKAAGVPYTILRATQFFEFLGAIAGGGAAEDGTVHLSPALAQPVAADDVAATLAGVAVGAPVNGTIELAGQEAVPLEDIVRRYLQATGDDRTVTGDPAARYFGADIDDRSLVPAGDHHVGAISFADWLSSPAGQKRK
jgi:uncharacterized protein YbjT (DUF2867 family)